MTRAEIRLALVLIFGMGLVLHGVLLTGRGLNTDEVYFPLAARDGHLFDSLRHDVHPPLYPLLVKACVATDLPVWSWRLISLLAWFGVAGFAFGVGRRLADAKTGLIAAALLVSSPQGMVLGHLVRSYALAAFLAALACWALVRLLERPTPRRAAALALALAAGVYTFYFFLYIFAALALVGLDLARRRHPGGRYVLDALGVATLLFLPWVPILLAQATGSLGGGWEQWSAAPARILRRVGQILATAGGIDGLEPAIRALVPRVAGVLATAATGVLFLTGAALWIWPKKFKTDSENARISQVILLKYNVFVIALALGAHYILGAFIGISYFAILAAPVAVVFAVPLARARLAGGALLAALLVANITAWSAAAPQGDEPLDRATEWLDARLSPGDPVLGVAWFAVDGYRWYGGRGEAIGLPFDLPGRSRGARVQPGVIESGDLAQLRDVLKGRDRVALLLTHTAWRGHDRGVAGVADTLRASGFTLATQVVWPSLRADPTVRAQIWRKSSSN